MICDSWFPIQLRHGEGILWWCKHNIGFIEGGDDSDFSERHAEKVRQSQEYSQLKAICDSFMYRTDIINPGPGWYCEHGFLVATITELAVDNLRGWHYNYTKDKEELDG